MLGQALADALSYRQPCVTPDTARHRLARRYARRPRSRENGHPHGVLVLNRARSPSRALRTVIFPDQIGGYRLEARTEPPGERRIITDPFAIVTRPGHWGSIRADRSRA